VAHGDRRRLGSTDAPVAPEVDDAFERSLDRGVQRLHRPSHELLVTGLVGGIEIAVGVMAMLAVLDATGSQLLAGLAFSIGFLALLLGHSELFTEGFLVPVLTVAAKRASPSQLFRLWSGTLVTNLIGGWLVMWLVVAAFPQLHEQLIESAAHFAQAPLSVQSFSLAVLAGAVMTLMTRMEDGTDSMPAKIVAVVGAAFLLVGLELFHAILDSLLIFGALHTGQATFGYLDWVGWFAYTAVGNMLGGLGLVTLLRVVRSKNRLGQERHEVEHEQDDEGRRSA
jgi:formate/nitrite transporter FocA (FNT family)